MPLPLQRSVVPDGAEGAPGSGLTVTFSVAGEETPQLLLETTETVAVPVKAADQVTVALDVVPLMVFPVPVMLHVNEVALEDDVV